VDLRLPEQEEAPVAAPVERTASEEVRADTAAEAALRRFAPVENPTPAPAEAVATEFRATDYFPIREGEQYSAGLSAAERASRAAELHHGRYDRDAHREEILRQHIEDHEFDRDLRVPVAALRVQQEIPAPAGPAPVEEGRCALRVRRPDGSVLLETFNSTTTFRWLIDELMRRGEVETEEGAGEPYVVVVPFPRRRYGVEELGTTLQQAELGQRGTVVLQRQSQVGQAMRGVGPFVPSTVAPGDMEEDEFQAFVEGHPELGQFTGGRTPLPDQELNSLRRRTHEEGQELQCVVCHCEVQAGEALCELPCSHAYHSDCINRWFRISQQCPLCRAAVS